MCVRTCLQRVYRDELKSNVPQFPINSHGGTLGMGFAGEVAPAMFALMEAVEQVRGTAMDRQCTRDPPELALVHASGPAGLRHTSAVVLFSNEELAMPEFEETKTESDGATGVGGALRRLFSSV